MPFINIKDGYISMKVTFDTRNNLHEKIDRFTSMMSKLTAQDDDQVKQFKPKYIKVKGVNRQGNFMINIMVREIFKMDTGQIVKIGEYCSVAEYNMARIVETDHGIMRTVKVNLEQEILEGISEQIQITEDKIKEVDIEKIIEMIIMKELEVGLGINNILIIEGTKEVTVGLDQVQEPVWTEIELDVINVGNVIIS